MTTAIYARISEDRADGAGVARQLADSRALCKRRGWTVAHEYVDNSISASRAGKLRPQYQAMMTAIEDGEINRICVYMVDRLYRRPRELEDLIDLAEAGRVEVYSTHSGEGVDLSSIDGATMARVVVAFAAGESRKISARVKRQQADRRAQGLHPGGTRPFGYERVDGRLVPKPDEVVLIASAMQSVLGGKSLANIAREWTRLGVEHPHPARGSKLFTHVYPWAPVSVSHILHSPRNLGRLTNARGEDVGVGEWPAIVSRELFEQCNATIAARNLRGTSRPSQRGMLTGLIHCGECGARMHRGRNAHGAFYRCPGSTRPGTCGKVGIIAEFVEALTVAAVRERLRDAKFVSSGTSANDDAKLAVLEAELATIDRKVEDLALRFADARGASARGFRLALDRLERQQRSLLAERDTLRAVSPIAVYRGNADALMADWDTLTADQQHAIIETVLHRITVAHVGKGGWNQETMRRRVTFG